MIWLMEVTMARLELLRFLDILDVDYRVVNVDSDMRLFEFVGDDLVPLAVDASRNVIVSGGGRLAKLAEREGWHPGALRGENFDIERWIVGWGAENMLNGDAVVSTAFDLIQHLADGPKFVRPHREYKLFIPAVIDLDGYGAWVHAAGLSRDTEVLVSTVKEIRRETRFFVLDGAIISASQYALGGSVVVDALVEEGARKFAGAMIDRWQPQVAFVLDIAETADGYRIVEVNGYTTSGCYRCDVGAIASALVDRFTD